MKCKPYGSSISKSCAPSVKELLYYSKYKTYKSETFHIILNMSKHHNRIVEFKLRLLEEPGQKTFGVTYVSLRIHKKCCLLNCEDVSKNIVRAASKFDCSKLCRFFNT